MCGVQCCSLTVWDAIISQLEALHRSSDGLTKEGLCQVFQVRHPRACYARSHAWPLFHS